MNALQREANRYLKARPVLDDLRRYEHFLSYVEYKAIKKQALEGDTLGALKKLNKIVLERRDSQWDSLIAGSDQRKPY